MTKILIAATVLGIATAALILYLREELTLDEAGDLASDFQE